MATRKNNASSNNLSFVIFTVLPVLLALSFAWIWYFPSSDQLIGWGDDPYFNLWTLEHVWNQLSTQGIFHLFSNSFWDTPILFPSTNTLAFSENQIFLGILSWPIRMWSGNGVFTLNLFAMLISLFTYFVSWKWFRSLEVTKIAAWGALLFQGCGWIQDHYAHYQNICIFLFPLAFLSWNHFQKSPNLFSALFCGLCFGIGAGWNMYFQVLLNTLFLFLFIYNFYTYPSKGIWVKPFWVQRSWLIFLAFCIALVQLPFILKYFEVAKQLGSMKASTQDWIQYSAHPSSILAHANQSTLGEKWVHYYPHIQLGIESVGFLGIVWLLLCFISIQNQRARPYLIAAFIAFWISLGPHYGLLNLVQFVPGVDGLRAIGRLQILVTFFSLTGILIFLEDSSLRFSRLTSWPHAALLLMVLEVFPGEISKRVLVQQSYFGEMTELEKQLALTPKQEPWLVVPQLSPKFQLSMLRAGSKLLDGYTGRTPLNTDLLRSLSHTPIDTHSLQSQMIFSNAKHIVSVADSSSQSLQKMPFLKSEGCFAHHEFHGCIFSPSDQNGISEGLLKQTRLQLDKDTYWTYPPQSTGHIGILKARRSGHLDYRTTGSCWIEDTLKFKSFPIYKTKRSLNAHHFHSVAFQPNDAVLERVSRQGMFSWPAWIRPQKTFEVICPP